MERLTKTYSDGTHWASDKLPCGERSFTYLELLIEKLGKYEDLEEQGRLLRLPCKVGDTVYKITRNFISEYKIISATIYPYSIQFNWQCTKGIYGNLVGFADLEIGKTVFLTREEAEAKLKEMEESHD